MSTKLKIIDVAEFYAPQGGGVRTYIDLKLQAAHAHGHELVVIAPGAHDHEERRFGGRIVWVGSPALPPDPRYRLLVRKKAVHAVIDREAPHVVEASSPWTGAWIVAHYRATHSRPPLIKSLIYHHDPVAVYPQTLLGARFGTQRVDAWCAGYWAYLRSLSRHFDVTLVSGHWLARRLWQHGVGNARAVPFGIDKALFSCAQPDPRLRRALLRRAGANEQAALLITVSRLHPEKRLGTLFKAVELLSTQRAIALVVYGDGPLDRYCQLRARGLPIYLAGMTRDRVLLSRALASADALLHGSSAETFGLVVAEALCAGLPVVVPNAGGAFELARPAHAESYPAGDPHACASAAARLLARMGPSLRAATRTAAQSLVLSHEQHWEQLFAAYETLAGRHARQPVAGQSPLAPGSARLPGVLRDGRGAIAIHSAAGSSPPDPPEPFPRHAADAPALQHELRDPPPQTADSGVPEPLSRTFISA